MSVYNAPVSPTSALPELWIAPVAFHENARVGTAEAFAESTAAVRNEAERHDP